MKFNVFQPWSDYSILYTDYESHSVVYGCDNFIGGMIRFDWLWTLTRVPNPIGSAAHTEMEDTVFKLIYEKLSSFVPESRLRQTQ